MTMVLEPQQPQRIDAEAVHVVVAAGRGGACEPLVQALDALFDEVELSEAGTLAALGRALAGAAGRRPDLVLLDLALPRIGGFPGLLYLRAQNPDVPIAVVSSTRDRVVMRRLVEVGAAGIIPRESDAETLREAIRAMLDGEIVVAAEVELSKPLQPDEADALRRLSSLTPQQLRVLTMLAQGLLNKQVAYELSVSEATVKAHVSAILQKLGVEGRAQAVAAVCRIEGGCFTRAAAER